MLRGLTDEVLGVLGEDFVGLYLLGSFALGDGDEFSDVDFLVVTERLIERSQETRIRSIHQSYPDQDIIWAQHLEGSYAPYAELRTLDAIGKPWLYVDNGSKQMERSAHCNTALTRWMMREHGVVLAGRDPASLVEPVSPDDLRLEARRMAASYREWVEDDPRDVDDAWAQPYIVVTFCRILSTHATGRILTKRQALQWALEVLDDGWQPLIRQALNDRPDPWDRVGKPARPERVEPTRRFVRYAMDLLE